jgi:hypothetical protein
VAYASRTSRPTDFSDLILESAKVNWDSV